MMRISLGPKNLAVFTVLLQLNQGQGNKTYLLLNEFFFDVVFCMKGIILIYQINSWSFDNKSELPAYLTMVTAARQDSVSGMYACQRITKGMRYHVNNGCFDGAHDATDFYIMARDVLFFRHSAEREWDMRPFIPLNKTNEGNIKNLPMSTMTEDGIPICQAGHQMYYNGYCKDRDRLKWRCPIRAKKSDNLKCDYLDTCSQFAYGRVIYTHPKDNPRLYTPVARGTDKWQDIYDHRTSAERVFKREKNDFKLTDFRTRSKERYLFYALLTAIAVHIDTWYRVDANPLADRANIQAVEK